MTSLNRTKVLCVDDEAPILQLLTVLLGRHYDLTTFTDGPTALKALQHERGFAVIVSDMHMPAMDGATFLGHCRQIVPDASRVLLTGQPDVKSAIAAVNEGHIFRFLTKPCPPPALLSTVQAAAEQHRLVTAERVLLEQTLHGCIKALTDILALGNPATFGCALRIKRHVTDLSSHIAAPDRWQVEVAAMFSQVGLITLPPETVEKVNGGAELLPEELAMMDRLPSVADQLLANIPRLETVRAILANARRPYRAIEPGLDEGEAAVRRAGHVLRVAMDFDSLDARGMDGASAVGMLRGRVGAYDPALLKALEGLHSGSTDRMEVREVRIAALRPGMVCAEDVHLASGSLLVARGYEVTQRFIDRVSNFSAATIKSHVRVVIPKPTPEVSEAPLPA